MLSSRAEDPFTSVLPVVCVVAVSAVAVVIVVAWLVREVALRAIEKSTPDQVASVVLALAALVSPFRWIWPWSDRRPLVSRDETERQPALGDSREI